MKKYVTSKESYLDVCCLHTELQSGIHYYTTLLAHAAIHGQKKMVIELIENGASKEPFWCICVASTSLKGCCFNVDIKLGNCLSGSPLTQMLVYALHHKCPEAIDGEIVELLINIPLDVNVFYYT